MAIDLKIECLGGVTPTQDSASSVLLEANGVTGTYESSVPVLTSVNSNSGTTNPPEVTLGKVRVEIYYPQ